MLPPLFPDDIIEAPKHAVSPQDTIQDATAGRSYRALSSGVWMIGGVFASIFGVMVVLVLSISALSGSETSLSASDNSTDLGMAGQVYGAWTDQQLDSDGSDGPFNAEGLSASLQEMLAEYPEAKFGIVIAPVGSGGHVRIHDDSQFRAASTTKILTAAAVLAGVEKGTIRLDQIAYQIKPKTEQDKPADDSTQTKPTPTPSRKPAPTPTPTPKPKNISVNDALRLMVNQSDNHAWEQLIGLVGSRNLQQYAEELGMQHYDVRENKVSAADMALLLQKLYSRQLLSESHTELLLSWMQKTNDDSMIPAGMNDVGQVYHKYGWLGSSLHDVAIVENDGNPVVVAIFTQGITNYADGKVLIRRMAEVVEGELIR